MFPRLCGSFWPNTWSLFLWWSLFISEWLSATSTLLSVYFSSRSSVSAHILGRIKPESSSPRFNKSDLWGSQWPPGEGWLAYCRIHLWPYWSCTRFSTQNCSWWTPCLALAFGHSHLVLSESQSPHFPEDFPTPMVKYLALVSTGILFTSNFLRLNLLLCQAKHLLTYQPRCDLLEHLVLPTSLYLLWSKLLLPMAVSSQWLNLLLNRHPSQPCA